MIDSEKIINIPAVRDRHNRISVKCADRNRFIPGFLARGCALRGQPAVSADRLAEAFV